MEKIEKSELIELLKKISENVLTDEIEVEVPLGLPHGIEAGIRPQIVKVDVKWLINQILSQLEPEVEKESENVNIAVCVKAFSDIFAGSRMKGADILLQVVNVGNKFIIVSKDDDFVSLKKPDSDIIFTLSTTFYNEHFKDSKDLYPTHICKHTYTKFDSRIIHVGEAIALRSFDNKHADIFYQGERYTIPAVVFEKYFESI